MNRFDKQNNLPGYSKEEQDKLQKAKILVVGAGGLGCPALLYLAAMGAGCLGIADGDTVDLSNLNRQVLYGENDIGKPKAATASHYLESKYNNIRIHCHSSFLTPQNAFQIISDYDIVLDCTDNFSTRYLINDACVLLKKPLVFGAIYQHEGQVMAFHPSAQVTLNYRHVYPEPPGPNEIPDCNTTGVLGVLPGLIGVMMATETVKLITGFGENLVNKILFYNITNNSQFVTEIVPHPKADALIPVNETEFLNRDYGFHCANDEVINWETVLKNMKSDSEDKLLVDVREEHEQPKINALPFMAYPLSEIISNNEKELKQNTLYIFCQSGIRSRKAAKILKEKFPLKKILSIEGGINKANVHLNSICYENA